MISNIVMTIFTISITVTAMLLSDEEIFIYISSTSDVALGSDQQGFWFNVDNIGTRIENTEVQ